MTELVVEVTPAVDDERRIHSIVRDAIEAYDLRLPSKMRDVRDRHG